MKKSLLRSPLFSLIVIIAALLFSVLTARYSVLLAIAEIACITAVTVWLLVSRFFAGRRIRRLIKKLTEKFDYSDNKVLNNLPFAVLVCDSEGKVKWFSEKFLNRVLDGNEQNFDDVTQFTNGMELDEIAGSQESSVFLNGRFYAVYSNSFTVDDSSCYALYYLDVTEYREIKNKYLSSRPSVILIKADNIGNTRLDVRDSERAEIRSMIEGIIENWCSDYTCIMKRLSDSRYIIVAEKNDVEKMMADKFSVLDKVRVLKYKNMALSSSLSIGVSEGESYAACERGARRALEMAMGRGGDQAAVAVKDSYEFFGGLSKSIENRTKTQSRVIASALAELIDAADEVIVMGHKWPDLDAIGAALGICAAARTAKVPAFIATDVHKNLAGPLLERISENPDYNGLIIDEAAALKKVDKKTLLVVVDTHLKHYVEFPEVYQKATTVFVVDHHRKTMDYIDNAVVFHLDPSASSASELVTELLQYMNPSPDIDTLTAEGLLAGIMLDTKNFVIRSGVRTFEGAAFLKENNADTVSVRKLFSNSMEVNQLRNKVISNAVIHNGCAVSTAEFSSRDLRIICSQAADELLNITGVKASFVVFQAGSGASVSARSLGEVNVQLIMEALGGGGHLTMAAAQLTDCTVDETKAKLIRVLDDTFSTVNDKNDISEKGEQKR